MDLVFSEATIVSVSESMDGRGNEIVRMSIKGPFCNTVFNLYPYDLKYLTQILECDISNLKGKKVTGVSDGSMIYAIGYQGMYVQLQLLGTPLKSSGLLSEYELCSLLNGNVVIRYNSSGNIIARYEVPIQREKTGRI